MRANFGPRLRLLVLVAAVAMVWPGCGVHFIGTQQIRDACDYSVESARICPDGEHRYTLQGICWLPQGLPLLFQASLRFDESTGKAREAIEGSRLGDEETREAATTAQCNRDPFLLLPASTCHSTTVDASWLAEVPVAFQVPVASGLVHPLTLAGHDLTAGCSDAVPEPPPPPHKGTGPIILPGLVGKITLLQITSPVENELFTPADASFQLAVEASGLEPAALDVEWQELQGRTWADLAQQDAVPFGSVPLTVPLSASKDKEGAYRVRVRVAGSGAPTPWRTFQTFGVVPTPPG